MVSCSSPLATRLSRSLALALLLAAGCSGPGATRHEPVLSRIESDPEGAAVFVEGGFVGTTPAEFFLPAKDRVAVRLELPGYLPQSDLLLRGAGVPEDAEEGVGWEELYYYPLTRKGDS